MDGIFSPDSTRPHYGNTLAASNVNKRFFLPFTQSSQGPTPGRLPPPLVVAAHHDRLLAAENRLVHAKKKNHGFIPRTHFLSCVRQVQQIDLGMWRQHEVDGGMQAALDGEA
jgi:hypothetical protein